MTPIESGRIIFLISLLIFVTSIFYIVSRFIFDSIIMRRSARK